jgi:hypothetical protein
MQTQATAPAPKKFTAEELAEIKKKITAKDKATTNNQIVRK